MSEPGTPGIRRVRPAERYGDARGPRGRVALGVGVLLAACALGLIGWIAYHWAFPPARWGFSGYTISSDRAIQAEFWVRRDPADRLVCTVQARNLEHDVVGSREVEIAAGAPAQQSVTTTLRTSDRPVNAELAGCRVLE